MKTIVSEGAPTSRILYVEDHEDSRVMLTCFLENTGYAVSTAASIADGLSLAKLEPFDLYILDSRFADGSGIELCLQIRAFDPLTPIIFYSSSAYQVDIAAGLAAGAQAYLTKPRGIYTITQTIAELLNGAKVVPVDRQRVASQIKSPVVCKVSFIECLA
jgi:two-component system response regulator ArlR